MKAFRNFSTITARYNLFPSAATYFYYAELYGYFSLIYRNLFSGENKVVRNPRCRLQFTSGAKTDFTHPKLNRKLLSGQTTISPDKQIGPKVETKTRTTDRPSSLLCAG